MRIVLSFLFDCLTDPLGLPIGVLEEYIILFTIEVIAFLIAYAKVGEWYLEGVITTKIGGSIIHWTVRAFSVLSIWAATYCLIWTGKLIANHWLVATVISLIVLCVGTVLYASLHRNQKGVPCNKEHIRFQGNNQKSGREKSENM